jgi:predicted flap endonuclease-1-like 5' DNA nuclease
VPELEGVPPTPDDLKLIEGIGPKISGVLNAAGITTFAQLAERDAQELERIVKGAGIRLVFPGTWGAQAELAAAGRWEELAVLQGNLKAGRRV